jgi:hypothetical protein
LIQSGDANVKLAIVHSLAQRRPHTLRNLHCGVESSQSQIVCVFSPRLGLCWPNG